MKLRQLLPIVLGLVVLSGASAWLGARLALRWPMRGLPPAESLPLGGGFIDRMERVLDLSEDQRAKAARAIERARADIRSLSQDTSQRAAEIRRRLRADLDPILTPRQRVELDRRQALRARLVDRWKHGAAESDATNPPSNPRP
ncbi:MAG: hypothetical protein IT581_00725 [Verrucomicrobiales bacterium]|nr:hypothetical protein [Verrucomicrobiales bacterium]